MVEDLRRFTQALDHDGWHQAAEELMAKAEELERGGSSPQKFLV